MLKRRRLVRDVSGPAAGRFETHGQISPFQPGSGRGWSRQTARSLRTEDVFDGDHYERNFESAVRGADCTHAILDGTAARQVQPLEGCLQNPTH